MRAYHFSAIFILGAKFHNAYGCRVANSEQSIKTWLFSQPDIIARSCVGYALTHFSCGLIDPEIAPMNREDT